MGNQLWRVQKALPHKYSRDGLTEHKKPTAIDVTITVHAMFGGPPLAEPHMWNVYRDHL